MKPLAAEKPVTKPLPRKQPEWNPTTRVPMPEPTKSKNKKKNNSLKLRPKNQKTDFSVSAEEEEAKDESPAVIVLIPAALPVTTPGSPYHSAKICSKCRFDKLETASYWLGLINLSESVGKHFVSVGFFRLALESKAEPIKKLRSELKRYLARNGNIKEERVERYLCELWNNTR